uniref:Uncharacterized protein n=1 Tax=Aegilops tauschii subsp. strangulata TaxID=200361 RepID=A0A453JM46_AEGTS
YSAAGLFIRPASPPLLPALLRPLGVCQLLGACLVIDGCKQTSAAAAGGGPEAHERGQDDDEVPGRRWRGRAVIGVRGGRRRRPQPPGMEGHAVRHR